MRIENGELRIKFKSKRTVKNSVQFTNVQCTVKEIKAKTS